MNLSEREIDALKELINIGVGRAAGVLSEMIEAPISLNVPSVKVLAIRDLLNEIDATRAEQLSAVKLGFKGSFSGTAALLFPPDSASKLVSVLIRDEKDVTDLDSLRVGTLNEVGNIVINGVMGSIANLLKQHITYSLPTYIEERMDRLIGSEQEAGDETVLLAHTFFKVEQYLIEGNILLVFESASFGSLITAIGEDISENLQ